MSKYKINEKLSREECARGLTVLHWDCDVKFKTIHRTYTINTGDYCISVYDEKEVNDEKDKNVRRAWNNEPIKCVWELSFPNLDDYEDYVNGFMFIHDKDEVKNNITNFMCDILLTMNPPDTIKEINTSVHPTVTDVLITKLNIEDGLVKLGGTGMAHDLMTLRDVASKVDLGGEA